MKGVIFNLLEEVVVEKFGDAVWEQLLETSGSDGVYTALGSYPDAEMVGLLDAASELTGETPRALLYWFGTEAIPKLAERYPAFFENAPDARSFILSVNTIIHPEVRKLYSGASCPHFGFTEESGALTVDYSSPRKLCDLARGFMEGVAALYEEEIAIEKSACMHEGAPSSQFVLTWAQ